MEMEDNTLCCGCLCFGRKMIRLGGGGKQQFLTHVIGEISMSEAKQPQLQLCWECYARLNNFAKFTEQVKRSYHLFSEYLKQNKPKSFLDFSPPNLTTHKLYTIDIQLIDNTESSPTIEDIKTENQRQLTPEPFIKEEYDTAIPETNSDDEKLIDISKKIAKVKRKKRKRKERVFKEIELSIQLIDNTESSPTIEVIKTENQRQLTPEPFIKEEYDTAIPETNSDDEKLIDISKKIAKVKRKKRKRKERVFKEIELSREELEEERKVAMLAEDYVNAMFQCERCIVSFPNAEDLSDHVRLKHELNASNHKCPICECSFSSEVSYNYHTNKHTRRYQCALCTERYSSKRAAVKHYQLTHCHGPLIEFEVHNAHENEVKTDETDDLKDNSITQQSATFPCDFCEKIFRWKTSLRKHIETHRIETGQKRKPYCEPCRLSFTTTSNLQKHVKTSSKHQIQLKLRKLTASLPPSESTSERHLAHIDHIRNTVNSARQKYPCAQCGKSFQWRGNLLRHVNTHVARANGELVCEPCNRTFSSIATYKQHMKISKKHVSENEFKYMCSECGKRFANKTRLKDHVNWEHLKNYVHTCNICQKVFKSHTSLYLHRQVVHKKDNAEHLCDHCGKPFPNHAKLRSHITAIHSGTSAYKCVTCGARFSWHSCLSRHNRKLHAIADKVE